MIKARVEKAHTKFKATGTFLVIMSELSLLTVNVILKIAKANEIDASELVDLHVGAIKAAIEEVEKEGVKE